MILASAGVAGLGLSVAACGSGATPQASGHRSPTTAAATSKTAAIIGTTLPPEAGYRGIENFCAVAPLTGTIHYDGTSGGLTGVLTVSAGGLPPNDAVDVNWSNDYVRVPVIAGFKTDSKGTAIQSSVDVGRLGEVRGVEIVLTAASVPDSVLGRLEPC